jgi:hypothetical protein
MISARCADEFAYDCASMASCSGKRSPRVDQRAFGSALASSRARTRGAWSLITASSSGNGSSRGPHVKLPPRAATRAIAAGSGSRLAARTSTLQAGLAVIGKPRSSAVPAGGTGSGSGPGCGLQPTMTRPQSAMASVVRTGTWIRHHPRCAGHAGDASKVSTAIGRDPAFSYPSATRL